MLTTFARAAPATTPPLRYLIGADGAGTATCVRLLSTDGRRLGNDAGNGARRERFLALAPSSGQLLLCRDAEVVR